jgi:heme/copper-type cytochrome/quinol oxidase subunit 2
MWELACAEFCGARHSLMRGKLYVHKDKTDFLDWLKYMEAEQNRHEVPNQKIVATK